MAEAAGAADPPRSGPAGIGLALPSGPLTLEENARLLGAYVWIERQLFELVGASVGHAAEHEVRDLLARESMHHAWHAELWEARLPHRAEPEVDVWVGPPHDAVAAAFDALGDVTRTGGSVEVLVGLSRVVVPRLVVTYRAHLAATTEVADAAVARALRFALADEVEGWQQGEALLQRLLATGDLLDRATTVQRRLEATFVGAAR